MFKLLTIRALLSAAVLALASLHASAALVTSRAALAETGSLGWAQLGADSTTVAAPAAASTSIAGLSASASNPGGGGQFTRFDEAGGTWAGNFASGAALLTTFGSGGSIKIDFNQGVSRAGAQIQGFDSTNFDGVISVYGSSNNLLEHYSVTDPDVNFTPNDSAMFLGISRNLADIHHVTFNISGPNNLEFGINQLSLSQYEVPSVPEPGSVALMALGLAGLGIVCRRNRR